MSLYTTGSQEVRKAGRIVCDGNLRLIEILRISVLQIKDLPLRKSRNAQTIKMSVSLDTEKIHQTTASPSGSVFNIGYDFIHEITSNFSKLHIKISEEGRSSRPIGRVSLKKRDIVKYSGKPFWQHVSPIPKENDIFGQICVDVQFDNDTSRLSLKVLNYAGLTTAGPLNLLVTLQGLGDEKAQKLSIGQKKDGEDKLVFENVQLTESNGSLPQLRMALWRDIPNSDNSSFHGQVCIPLSEATLSKGPQWCYLKPRLSPDDSDSSPNGCSSKLGEVYLQLYYTADHILPLESYQPLHTNLINSLSLYPFFSSLVGILDFLPGVDRTSLARPLMKLFINAEEFSPLLRIFGSQDIQNCSDVNTLFRSQSMTSKIIHEEMKFLGHNYLSISLKPVIDKIYNDKRCCEVDPAKLKPGDDLEMNKLNLIFYGEMAFSGMVESFQKCPTLLRRTFSDLRELVDQHHPNRIDLQRLAVSSFIVLRFFAAAIMNPKLMGLKGEQPDAATSRTLVLLSKILQRASNSAISEKVLNAKELWLSPILQRFTDEKHKKAMLRFLDGISLVECDTVPGNENPDILCSAVFIQRRPKRKIFTNFVHQKRRFVALTEKELWWKKSKDDEKRKGEMDLHEIKRVEPVRNVKNVFRIATSKYELLLQANSSVEMNHWLLQLQLQTEGKLQKDKDSESEMEVSSDTASSCLLDTLDPFGLYDIDTERELETIHMTLFEHAETLKYWKNALEGLEVPEGHPPLPEAVIEQINNCKNPEEVKEQFHTTIENVLLGTLLIENAHQEAVNRFISQIRGNKGSQELMTGDDNYLLLKSRFPSSVK